MNADTFKPICAAGSGDKHSAEAAAVCGRQRRQRHGDSRCAVCTAATLHREPEHIWVASVLLRTLCINHVIIVAALVLSSSGIIRCSAFACDLANHHDTLAAMLSTVWVPLIRFAVISGLAA